MRTDNIGKGGGRRDEKGPTVSGVKRQSWTHQRLIKRGRKQAPRESRGQYIMWGGGGVGGEGNSKWNQEANKQYSGRNPPLRNQEKQSQKKRREEKKKNGLEEGKDGDVEKMWTSKN